MRRFLKWFGRLLIGLTVVFSLVALTIVLVINTQPGTRWAIDRVNAAIPGEIGIEQFDGTLWAGLRIPLIAYRDTQLELDATGLEIVVDWSSVTLAQLVLSELTADSIEYRNLAAIDPAPKPFEFAMDPIPLTIGVEHGRIGNLLLSGRSSDDIEIRNFVLDVASLNGNTIRVTSVSASSGDFEFSAADLNTQLGGDVPLSMEFTWSFLDDDWSGVGSVAGSLAALQFDHSLSGQYSAEASGSIILLNRIEPEVDARVSWDQWTISDYLLEGGDVQIRGTTSQYDVDYDLIVQLPSDERIGVAGTGSGNIAELTTFAAQVSHQAAAIELDGSVAWQPSFSAEAQVHASGFDPSIVVETLTGDLSADAHISVDGDGNLTITNAILDGVFNGVPSSAQGTLSVTPAQIRCDECLLAVGENRLSIDGASDTGNLALTMSIDAPSLDLLWPQFVGNLKGQGRFSGSRARPQFTGELHGEQVRFADWSAGQVSVRSQASTIDTYDLTLAVEMLSNAGTDYGSFEVISNGTLNTLDLSFDWQFRGLEISAAGKALRNEMLVEGVVTRATVIDPNSGTWLLEDSIDFQLQDGDVLVEPHLWSNAPGQLRVTRLSKTGDELALAASLVNWPLQTANPFLPSNFRLQGSARAEIDVIQNSGAWSGSVNWGQDDTILSVLEANELATNIEIPLVEVVAELRNGGADVSAELNIEPGVKGELDLELAGFSDDSPIKAELRLSGNDWYWIPAIIPTIDSFEGAIAATINASGPMLAPEFSGSLNWRAGSLAVPALNVPITEIELAVAGASNGAATVSGSARAGDGELEIEGRIEDLMRSSRSVKLEISGTGAELVNWPEYRLWASPDLVIAGTNAGWTMNGEVEVPRAEITLRELPEEAVVPSPDVTVIGREEESEEAIRISGETKLVFGDGVHVQALGLDTRLQGNLIVNVARDRPLIAEGQVTLVDGDFSAYGQKLTIKEGTLTFTGPLDNPLVDVRAVRVIETFEGQVTAGIHLRGRAQSLTSTVYSEPVMAEADALSYLVLGRPLSQASGAEGGELSSAAIGLGVRQATRVTEQVGQALGLDQLTLAGNGGDTTALVAGKQINSRLHARYAYGVFSRLGTLLLRYRMSKRLTLEAGAGEAQSIDLLYLVEKE